MTLHSISTHGGCTAPQWRRWELSLRAVDPYVRDRLRKVSEDESRHAELAYRVVQWLLQEHPELRHAADALSQRVLGFENPPHENANAENGFGVSEHDLLAHGIASQQLSREVRNRMLNTVVGPCLRALLESHSSVELSAAFA